MQTYTNVSEALEAYNESLDEIYGDFMGSYPASRVLREVDPIAYRVGFHDFLDSEECDSEDLEGWDQVDL